MHEQTESTKRATSRVFMVVLNNSWQIRLEWHKLISTLIFIGKCRCISVFMYVCAFVCVVIALSHLRPSLKKLSAPQTTITSVRCFSETTWHICMCSSRHADTAVWWLILPYLYQATNLETRWLLFSTLSDSWQMFQKPCFSVRDRLRVRFQCVYFFTKYRNIYTNILWWQIIQC